MSFLGGGGGGGGGGGISLGGIILLSLVAPSSTLIGADRHVPLYFQT